MGINMRMATFREVATSTSSSDFNAPGGTCGQGPQSRGGMLDPCSERDAAHRILLSARSLPLMNRAFGQSVATIERGAASAEYRGPFDGRQRCGNTSTVLSRDQTSGRA